MKYLIALLLLISFSRNHLYAQNWRLIQHEKIPIFSGVADSLIYAAIKADSVVALPNGDSLLFNYRIENPDCDCHSWNLPSTEWSFDGGPGSCNMRDTGWLGLPVIISGDHYCFFNDHNDTIVIRSLDSVGSSWKFINFGSDRYVNATITSAYSTTVLGVLDSVKKITFDVRDTFGNIYPTSWTNNRKLLISKDHGLLEGFYFYYFNPAYDSLYYSPFVFGYDVFLAGYQLGPGTKLPTKASIYDFSVGDKFEYSGSVYKVTYVNGWPETYNDYWHSWTTIKAKVVHPHSVKYVVDQAKVYTTVTPVYHSSPTYTDSYSEGHGNVIFNIDDDFILPDQTPAALLESASDFWVNINDYRKELDPTHNGHRVRQNKTYGYHVDANLDYSGCVFESFTSASYSEAVGLGLISSTDATYTFEWGTTGTSMRLTYYEKGTDFGGTPFEYTGVRELEKSISCQLYPNPVADVLTIEVNNLPQPKELIISVFDMQGTKQLSGNYKLENGNAHLEMGRFSPGIYFVLVEDDKGRRSRYKITKI
jgi:hypothetical protein